MDVGAGVYINGKFRGDCPIDLQVPEGEINLRVTKKMDAYFERVYEDKFRIGADSAKKVEPILKREMTDAAQKRAKLPLSELVSLAEKGDPFAQVRVGLAYDNGEKVIKDKDTAMRWYRKAAEQGDSQGMYMLGVDYLILGLMAERDGKKTYADYYKEAFLWLQKASSLDHPEALIDLGNMYKNGHGTQADCYEAGERYTKAAALGNLDGNISLAKLYSPDGCPGNSNFLNREKALFFINEAQELSEGNKARLKRLGK